MMLLNQFDIDSENDIFEEDPFDEDIIADIENNENQNREVMQPRVVISNIMTSRDCKQAIIADREKKRVVLLEGLKSIQ